GGPGRRGEGRAGQGVLSRPGRSRSTEYGPAPERRVRGRTLSARKRGRGSGPPGRPCAGGDAGTVRDVRRRTGTPLAKRRPPGLKRPSARVNVQSSEPIKGPEEHR